MHPFYVLLFFYNGVDVAEVSAFLVIIQSISHDEIVRDFHNSIVDIKINLQVAWFHEEGTNFDAGWVHLLQVFNHVSHGETGIYDVLYDNHVAACQILVQPHQGLHAARRGGTLVRSILHE